MRDVAIVDGRDPLELGTIDPAADGGLDERTATERLDAVAGQLRELQELLFAAETNGVLVVLQGMDASGKDVTIQNVFRAATPEAIRVSHFTEPTDDERKHDFLWRAHAAAPGKGEVVIFDRSYYEQAVLPQVGEEEGDDALVDQRHDDIVAFERLLQRAGVLVVKFFLSVSPDEQRRRLVDRMSARETAWKISARDWTARRKWDAYMAAYERTVTATATPDAPWYVVPADRQWFHNLAIAEILVERMLVHRDEWLEQRDERGREGRAEVAEEAPEARDALRDAEF